MTPGAAVGATSASPFVGTFETGRHYRVHKSYIFAAPILAVSAVLVVVLLNGMQGWIDLFFAIRDGKLAVNVMLVVVAVVGGLVLVNAAFIGLYALAWRNMSYVFDEREFSYYSGIITKRRVHVPYARVQSVNHRASLVQRALGVCTVMIDSAGGSANKGVRVPYLRLETAERMRVELFMRKAAVAAGREAEVAFDSGAVAAAMPALPDNGAVARCPIGEAAGQRATGPLSNSGQRATGALSGQANVLDSAVGFAGDWRGAFGGAAVFGEEPVTYEHGLSNHELLLTTVSHDKPIVVALIVAFTFIFSIAFILLAQDEVSRFFAAAAVPIVAITTLFTWAIGLISTLVSYGNFRVRRRGSRIEVERGLLTRVSSGIDIERVQSIEIRQSFVRRLIGYCEVSLGRVNAVSEQNKGNNNSSVQAKGLVVHPFVKVDRVDEILAGLTPELADRPRRSECKPMAKPVLRRALLRRCLWFNWALWITVIVGITWAVIDYFVRSGGIQFADAAGQAQYAHFMAGSLGLVVEACAIFTAIDAVGAVLWARHSGCAWNRRYLLVHNDGLSTAECIIPRQKIQSGATRSNPFQRRLSLVTLQAVTAAGAGSTLVRLIDAPAEDGADYLEWLQ